MSRSRAIELTWGVRREGRSLWTRNAVKGVSVRGEKRKRDGRIEWRRWDPMKSKIAAGIITSKNTSLLPNSGSTCLYLGASSGGTVSHIHDFVCGAQNHHDGQVVAVEIAPRMMRDLAKLSESRPGLIPILGDARNPAVIAPYLRRKADWLHQDLSIADQAETFAKMTSVFLASEGIGVLSLKAASERWLDGGDNARFQAARELLSQAAHLEFLEEIDISKFEEQHRLFIVKRK